LFDVSTGVHGWKSGLHKLHVAGQLAVNHMKTLQLRVKKTANENQHSSLEQKITNIKKIEVISHPACKSMHSFYDIQRTLPNVYNEVFYQNTGTPFYN
jgi:hypothetical protein